MPFQAGQSGNPAGRPPGARNKATVMAEMLLQGEAEELTRLLIERAKAGDMAALRMCFDRVVPPSKHRVVGFELPPLENAADAGKVLSAVAAAAAKGEISPAEAGDFFKMIDTFARVLEATVFEQRLTRLERASGIGDADGDEAADHDFGTAA